MKKNIGIKALSLLVTVALLFCAIPSVVFAEASAAVEEIGENIKNRSGRESGEITNKTLKQMKKAFEGRDLGTKGRKC